MCRQAGDETESAETEIEVTPEMAVAGAMAAVKHDPMFHSHEEIAAAVWAAMWRAAPDHLKRSVCLSAASAD